MLKTMQSYFLVLALAVFAGVGLTGCGASANTTANANTQPQVIDVKTVQAVVKPIPTYIEATGNLASDAQTDVAPAVAGKIAEVNFDIGS
ncbi:MAG: efflux RND transporter periplasmic adaptor subunit, partial [Acidobacteria bacterium]|nr:efflux RND transporter periplasmic adaptor subunit [Acidobacteriota bacterium]